MNEILQNDATLAAEVIKRELGAKEHHIIERLGGLTNRTYHIAANDSEYCLRFPGEGTEQIIDRADEKKSTTLACSLGIDAELFYFGDDGTKIMAYIKGAQTMSSETLKQDENIALMADIFNKLHKCGKDTGVSFEVFDMAKSYEAVIEEFSVSMPDDFKETEKTVMEIKALVDSENTIKKAPCHNDALCENWIRSGSRMYLVDWEYAGMNDPMWDLADVSIEAEYDEAHDDKLLSCYLGFAPDSIVKRHFLASKLYVDYLWTLWAKARVPYDGQDMEDWANERYARLKVNIDKFRKIG